MSSGGKMAKTSTELRKSNGWHKGHVVHIDGDTANISVVFSWDVGKALTDAVNLGRQGYKVRIGGPAAKNAGVASSGDFPALQYHNPNAMFTSRGCPNHCSFCLVPTIEGDWFSAPDELWKDDPKPIICDNNPTASLPHFEEVCYAVRPLHGIDFNQGISAMTLTPKHCDLLRMLDFKVIRLAWDHTNYESKLRKGWELLIRHGIPANKITIYVLVGYKDSPADALYRLQTVKDWGSYPFAMRYQSLTSPKRNTDVGDNWIHEELVRYCRYWNNLRYTAKIPFAEFRYGYKSPKKVVANV